MTLNKFRSSFFVAMEGGERENWKCNGIQNEDER